jgi:hypothetical protein
VDGVLAAWEDVRAGADRPVAAVTVSAIVLSMCGVDSAGVPVTPGLLYRAGRGRGFGSGTDALTYSLGPLPVWLPYPRGERNPLQDTDLSRSVSVRASERVSRFERTRG